MLRVKSLDRKADMRRKIQLGGLVIKAQLENESTNVLFGLLLDAKEKLEELDCEKIRQHWRIKGDLAFSSEKEI